MCNKTIFIQNNFIFNSKIDLKCLTLIFLSIKNDLRSLKNFNKTKPKFLKPFIDPHFFHHFYRPGPLINRLKYLTKQELWFDQNKAKFKVL